MTCGIYKITNTKNSRIYIGSAVNIEQRWRAHKSYLNRNIHANPKLQASWNKYGQENFKFEVIHECLKDDLLIYEQYWIDFFKANNYTLGFNILAKAANRAGHKASAETRAKMSASQKERFKDPAQKIARNLVLIGNNFKKGKPQSLEARKATGNKLRGRQRPDHVKLAISLAHKGKKKTPEHMAKIWASRRANKLKESSSDEH